jgi:hypothetical protein
MIKATSSLSDVAAIVASALRGIGYDPVVVGGSACTLHAPNAYRSMDIDMVVIGGIDKRSELVASMKALGFGLTNGMFAHPESEYTVEFVPSPVAIGDYVIGEFATIATSFGEIRVLRAADAICDRFNKFVVWRDFDALKVAVDVARTCGVPAEVVEDFVDRHKAGLDGKQYILGYERFRARLAEGEPAR